ncbi:hypothetical protein ALQ74_200022 [Pseudomonas savastanoi pv. glycinea]|uniref:Uncharacterized protein n=1 Tax=Pseudomonas savastanoi pv. glycinea TaxID=318 RepID=A0A3M3FRY4_PSESG|nr:hypothetical protein ALQ74_200022 [Pseudomonas savastanoi pv. glycinea]
MAGAAGRSATGVCRHRNRPAIGAGDENQLAAKLGRALAGLRAKPCAGAGTGLLADAVEGRQRRLALRSPARRSATEARAVGGHATEWRADPATAARRSGGLSHADQRPAADRAGAGGQSLDRAAACPDSSGRAWPRRPLRHAGHHPYGRLVQQPVPGPAHAAGHVGRFAHDHQGTAARSARQGHWLRRPALSAQ